MPKLNHILPIFLVIIALLPAASLANKRIQTTQHLIVLDPGHGGDKTGITTSSTILEKNITLKLAQKTAAKLETNYNVLLTRGLDTTLSAAQRIAIANINHADLFLSIHLGKPGSTTGLFYYYSLPVRSSSNAFPANTWKTTTLKHTNQSRQIAETFLKIFSAAKTSFSFSIAASPALPLEGSDMPALLIEPFSISILPKNETELDTILDQYALLISKSIDVYFQNE